MSPWIVLTCTLVSFVVSQELISPCPSIFQYEKNTGGDGIWYGVATITSDVELNGVWFWIVLDKPAKQLGNYFGEIDIKDPAEYVLKNPRQKLIPNVPIQIRFWVKYNPGGPVPKLVSLLLNARRICPVTTQAAQTSLHLYTTKEIVDPLANLPSQGANQIDPVSMFQPSQNQQRPSRPYVEEDDFYKGDAYELLRRMNMKQNQLNAATCGTVIKQPRPLITYGQATEEGEFPWHAALYHSQGADLTYICGSSLITLRHLITVAHCVTKSKTAVHVHPDNLLVYLGKFYLRAWKNPGIQDRRVDSIIVHPKYNPEVFGSDIAILKLNEPARLTNYVRPICLWEGPIQTENIVRKAGTVVGWGYDETGKLTNELTKAIMPIVSRETCIDSYPEFYSRFTSFTTFCAGFMNGTSACNGDSGGALVLPKTGSNPYNPTWMIRGLVSIGVALQNRLKCDSSNYVVFTDVAKYMDFIKHALSQ